MGREQRRKQAKKDKRNLEYRNGIEENSIKTSTLVKLILAVFAILLILYYGLAVFVTKELDVSGKKEGTSESSSEDTSSSVSGRILASATFKQSPEVYYVYYYDFSDSEEEIDSSIRSKLMDEEVFRVDTSSGLNGKYVVDESGNREVQDIDTLKVVNPTLIKIDHDKVVAYYESKEEIINFLSE